MSRVRMSKPSAGHRGTAANAATLRELVRGPGVDTRRWVVYARVDDSPDAIDPVVAGVQGEDGCWWLDCTIIETGEAVRARWGMYLLPSGTAGASGIWLPPPRPGEEIEIRFNDGDPLHGMAGGPVFARGDGTSAIPAAVLAEPAAVHVIGDGARVILSSTALGGAAVKAPLVELGAEALGPLDGVVHGSGIDPFTGLTYTALGSASAVVKAQK